MKHLKVLGVASVALVALGITTATTALALPDISITLCAGSTCYPLHLEVTLLTAGAKLSTVSGKSLQGEGLLLLALAKELTALGTYEALVLHLENAKKTKCNSVGDKAGEALSRGTYHLVYTSLAGSSQGLQLGMLFLGAPHELECGTEEFPLVRGSVISSITGAGTEATELTSLSGALTGNGAGVPSIKFFYNDAGVAQQAKLETNFGAGFVQTALESASVVTVTALEGKMFVITGR
jgi:hypothetical protein